MKTPLPPPNSMTHWRQFKKQDYEDAVPDKDVELLPGETSWKYIPDFNRRYMLSNLGRIASVDTGKDRVMRPMGPGRDVFHVWVNDEQYTIRLGTVLAGAFLDPVPYPNPEVSKINKKLPWTSTNVTYDVVQKLPGEMWKPYKKCSVSDLGRVMKNETGRILKPSAPPCRHPPTESCKGKPCAFGRVTPNGDGKHLAVHRLVAELFLAPPAAGSKKQQVRHKDGNPKNNAASNLEWKRTGKQQSAAKEKVESEGDGKREYTAKKRTRPIASDKKEDVKKDEVFVPFPHDPEYSGMDGCSISNYGSLKTTDGSVAFPGTEAGEYYNHRGYRVNRLVARAFHGPPPPGKTQAHHIDEDKHNNHASNLMWATPSYNTAASLGQRFVMVNKTTKEEKYFISISSAARHFHVTPPTIRYRLNRGAFQDWTYRELPKTDQNHPWINAD